MKHPYLWVYSETPSCTQYSSKTHIKIYRQLILATLKSTMLDSLDSDICICNVAGNTSAEMINYNMVDQVF